jgi:hypothetical protein
MRAQAASSDVAATILNTGSNRGMGSAEDVY